MALDLTPPIAPMEALSVDEIPKESIWQYEPKWDGFRCLVFRNHDDVQLQSKSGRPFNRYFPEIVAAIGDLGDEIFVLDGEIAVPAGEAFSFDQLLQRIHPAQGRVTRLATETPAVFIAFDWLAGSDGRSMLSKPLSERRHQLEAFAARNFGSSEPMRLSPATRRLQVARGWLARVGATLDGVIAKDLHADYRPGERTAVRKVKNYRSADCVLGGFRYGADGKTVGSLLLGLYDHDGLLHHVGFTSAIATSERAALTAKLERLVAPPGFTGSAPGGPSRWSTERTGQWQPLKPCLVVEACYDHFSGGRFRHGTRILRWRPDKPPRQCTLDQIAQHAGNLLQLLGPRRR
jgi:ATP-dependent DNA ligase